MSKEWLEEIDKNILYFTPFYEEVRLVELFLEEDGGWCYSSGLLGADREYLGSDCLDDARQEVEELIIEHLEGEIEYSKHLLKSFKG